MYRLRIGGDCLQKLTFSAQQSGKKAAHDSEEHGRCGDDDDDGGDEDQFDDATGTSTDALIAGT